MKDKRRNIDYKIGGKKKQWAAEEKKTRKLSDSGKERENQRKAERRKMKRRVRGKWVGGKERGVSEETRSRKRR